MTPDQLNANPLPFAKLMGVVITKATPDLVEAELPVTAEVCTLGGILHGGAAMGLADTLGAVATFLNLPPGAGGTTTIESKTNFLAAAPVGKKVIGRTTPVHKGKRTQVWQTRIETEDGKLVALTTQTQMVV
jgi:uncharacterized protein (TIGR00369 family)